MTVKANSESNNLGTFERMGIDLLVHSVTFMNPYWALRSLSSVSKSFRDIAVVGIFEQLQHQKGNVIALNVDRFSLNVYASSSMDEKRKILHCFFQYTHAYLSSRSKWFFDPQLASFSPTEETILLENLFSQSRMDYILQKEDETEMEYGEDDAQATAADHALVRVVQTRTIRTRDRVFLSPAIIFEVLMSVLMHLQNKALLFTDVERAFQIASGKLARLKKSEHWDLLKPQASIVQLLQQKVQELSSTQLQKESQSNTNKKTTSQTMIILKRKPDTAAATSDRPNQTSSDHKQ